MYLKTTKKKPQNSFVLFSYYKLYILSLKIAWLHATMKSYYCNLTTIVSLFGGTECDTFAFYVWVAHSAHATHVFFHTFRKWNFTCFIKCDTAVHRLRFVKAFILIGFHLIRLLFLYMNAKITMKMAVKCCLVGWIDFCVRIILSPLTLTHVVAINFGMKREAILFKFLSTTFWFVF